MSHIVQWFGIDLHDMHTIREGLSYKFYDFAKISKKFQWFGKVFHIISMNLNEWISMEFPYVHQIFMKSPGLGTMFAQILNFKWILMKSPWFGSDFDTSSMMLYRFRRNFHDLKTILIQFSWFEMDLQFTWFGTEFAAISMTMKRFQRNSNALGGF